MIYLKEGQRLDNQCKAGTLDQKCRQKEKRRVNNIVRKAKSQGHTRPIEFDLYKNCVGSNSAKNMYIKNLENKYKK